MTRGRKESERAQRERERIVDDEDDDGGGGEEKLVLFSVVESVWCVWLSRGRRRFLCFLNICRFFSLSRLHVIAVSASTQRERERELLHKERDWNV